MWNLRSNSDVLDETWWEAGGNALWKRYAREDNINRDTNTLFLTDEQWAEFKAEAEKLTGWPLNRVRSCISAMIPGLGSNPLSPR